MKLPRIVSTCFALLWTAAAMAQFSPLVAHYDLYSQANSGADQDLATLSGSYDPSPLGYYRTDAYADTLPSTVHAYSTVTWDVQPWDIYFSAEACWDSLDFGAGNSCDVRSRLWLIFDLVAPSIVTTNLVGDPSTIDRWTGTNYVTHIDSTVTPYSSFVWNPGTYRIRADRSYQLFGNSTGCVPLYGFLHAEPVPEPGTMAVLGLGLAAVARRRRKAA